MLVCTDSLVKRYSDKLTLGPIHITLKPGEILGVMGPRHAGKTTLLRLLWGFLRPDRGTIEVFGSAPHLHQVSVRLRAGYLPQSPTFYQSMFARGFLDFVSAFYENWDRDYTDELLEDFDIPPTALVGTLSKANRTKLGLIAAVGHKPSLLLLDEPLNGVDPIPKKEILQFLKDAARYGDAGIIVSTPITDDLDSIVDTALLLNKGEVKEYDSAEKLKKQYGVSKLDDVFIQSVCNKIPQASAGNSP